MERDLGRDDWLQAARLALLKGGVEAVRVERLSRDLHVTKGSFYWHFKHREELLELLLREWEEELLQEIIPQLKGRRGREALRSLMRAVVSEPNPYHAVLHAAGPDALCAVCDAMFVARALLAGEVCA